MATFIVRVRDNREAVGIFSAEDLDELLDLVDEVTDAPNCEYAEIESGGVVWLRKAAALPLSVDWEEAQPPVLQLIGAPEVTEAWFFALNDDDLDYEPLVAARDIIANEP